MKILDYKFREDLLYDKDHSWVKVEDDIVIVGVTDFFQKTADEIIFIEIPLVGRTIESGQPYSSIESGKWVGRLKAPITGEIIKVNDELTDFPYLLNENPYDDGWVLKVKPANKDEFNQLFNLEDKESISIFEDFIVAEDKKIKEAKK